MIPVCVLRSNDICFTGIMRSFGTRDIPVIPIIFTWEGSEGTFFSEKSKYFKNPKHIANPYTEAFQAKQDLIELGKKLFDKYGEKLFIIPSSDTNLMFLLDNFDEIKDYFHFLGSPDFNKNRIDIIDKYQCYELLRANNVETPITFDVSSMDLIENQKESFKFPSVFKPKVKDYGQTFYRLFEGDKAVTCTSYEDFLGKVQPVLDKNLPIILQEKVEFEHKIDEIPFYASVDKNHEISFYNTAIKEYLQPFPYGTAVILRINREEYLLEEARKVVKAIKWRGPLMIEFIKDNKDDKWKVIEINGRPWLMIDFYRRAGLNYLAAMYEDFYKVKKHVGSDFLMDSIHISLKDLAKEYFEVLKHSADVSGFNNWLESELSSFKDFSFTYFDPEDPAPFDGELNYLKVKYQLDFKPVKDFVLKLSQRSF